MVYAIVCTRVRLRGGGWGHESRRVLVVSKRRSRPYYPSMYCLYRNSVETVRPPPVLLILRKCENSSTPACFVLRIGITWKQFYIEVRTEFRCGDPATFHVCFLGISVGTVL